MFLRAEGRLITPNSAFGVTFWNIDSTFEWTLHTKLGLNDIAKNVLLQNVAYLKEFTHYFDITGSLSIFIPKWRSGNTLL